ncbi:MAG: hypothetical protein K0S33_2484 [Bacteroidetes bacterium]|jgi:hypothetical protein|nr:hypothetical protein [Bacteroidota bacterium]
MTEYFTKIEAENARNIFVGLIGEKLASKKEGGYAELTEIRVEDTGTEILFVGEIQHGFVLRFVFGESGSLNQYEFTDLNGLPPIQGTRHALSGEDKVKLLTQSRMHGSWIHTNGKDQIKLSISAKEVELEILKNGEKTQDRFPSSANWINNVMLFAHNPDYCIVYATETAMGFGKLQTRGAANGEYEWQEKFGRVVA